MKKKIFTMLFAFLLVFSGFSSIQAEELSGNVQTDLDNNVEEVLYDEPLYMGTSEYYPEGDVRGNVEVIEPDCIACGTPHYVYTIYDMGITQTWTWLSNPYFVRSVARGESYTESQEVSASVTATFDGTWNTGQKQALAGKWGLSSTYSKKVTKTINFSGPADGYSSRSFYYKKGLHKHKLKIVEKFYDSGVLKSTKEYYKYANEPAIYSYSQDYK